MKVQTNIKSGAGARIDGTADPETKGECAMKTKTGVKSGAGVRMDDNG